MPPHHRCFTDQSTSKSGTTESSTTATPVAAAAAHHHHHQPVPPVRQPSGVTTDGSSTSIASIDHPPTSPGDDGHEGVSQMKLDGDEHLDHKRHHHLDAQHRPSHEITTSDGEEVYRGSESPLVTLHHYDGPKVSVGGGEEEEEERRTTVGTGHRVRHPPNMVSRRSSLAPPLSDHRAEWKPDLRVSTHSTAHSHPLPQRVTTTAMSEGPTIARQDATGSHFDHFRSLPKAGPSSATSSTSTSSSRITAYQGRSASASRTPDSHAFVLDEEIAAGLVEETGSVTAGTNATKRRKRLSRPSSTPHLHHHQYAHPHPHHHHHHQESGSSGSRDENGGVAIPFNLEEANKSLLSHYDPNPLHHDLVTRPQVSSEPASSVCSPSMPGTPTEDVTRGTKLGRSLEPVKISMTRSPSPKSNKSGKISPHVVPFLIQYLNCPACHRLLRDPTTLGCGHSICIGCALGPNNASLDLSTNRSISSRESSPDCVASSSLRRKPIGFSTISTTLAPSESQFTRNPERPVSVDTSTTSTGTGTGTGPSTRAGATLASIPNSAIRSTSPGSLIAGLLHRGGGSGGGGSTSSAHSEDQLDIPQQQHGTSAIRHPSSNAVMARVAKVKCPHPGCVRKLAGPTAPPVTGSTSAGMAFGRELKIDYVLQKVLSLLRRDIPGLDAIVNMTPNYDDHDETRDDESEEDDGDLVGEDESVEDQEAVHSEKKSESMSKGNQNRDSHQKLGDGSRYGSASSGSSAGGGEDPVNEDESKRTHRTAKKWESSKRVKRRSTFVEESTKLRFDASDHDMASHGPTTVAGDKSTKDDAAFGNDSRLERSRLHLASLIPQPPSSFVAELMSELECQVCVQLFHEPITSPCGHTFCQKCLARAHDHSDKCPLCRADFPSYSYFQSQSFNFTTRNIIQSVFPSIAAERKVSIESEEKSTTLDRAIFVCTLAWPNLPTYIHIFEPRYRLMIRRVMEGDRQFGMVLPSRGEGGFSEYGTMLYIQNCNMIEDGRSIVETIGTYRFRVLEKGTLDGYTVGKIERVDDVSAEQEMELERLALARNNPPGLVAHVPGRAGSIFPPAPSGSPPGELGSDLPAQTPIELSTEQLMNVCLDFVQMLRSGSAPWVLQRLNNTIGPMPTNPSDFSFWMAEVMPVDDHVKAALLQITSPRERLRLLVFWIEQFRSSWWFSRGCSIM